MSDFQERLRRFLDSRGLSEGFALLTADASTREYFRIGWEDTTAIACVYPEAFDPSTQNYLDVTRLFVASGLPVPAILDVEGEQGVIVQEDLGDRVLRDFMFEIEPTKRRRLRDEAISLIARIQAATPRAFKMHSISSQLRFDTEKLEWELGFFK